MYLGSVTSLKRFGRMLLPALGLEFANELPFMLNFAFLGSYGDPVPISVFGLTNFFFNIMIFPVGYSLIEVAGVQFAKRFGERNFPGMSRDLARTVLTLTLFVLVLNLLCFFSEEIFLAANVEPSIAARTSRLVKFTGPICSVMFYKRGAQAYLASQEVVDEFLLPNFAATIAGIVVAKLAIIDWGMQEMGIIPAEVVQEIIGFSVSTYYLWVKALPETYQFPPISEVLQGYGGFLGKLFYSVAGTIAEFVTFEINTFMAIQLNDLNQLAIYVVWSGIAPFFYQIGMAFAAAIRIIVGTLMGEGRAVEARLELQASFAYTTAFSIASSLFFLVFAGPVADIFVNNELIAGELRKELLAFAFFVWSYVMFYPVFQAFRLLEEEKYFLKVITTLYLGGNVILAWFLAYACNLQALGLVVAHGFIGCVVQLFLCNRLLLNHPWPQSPPEISQKQASDPGDLTAPLVPKVQEIEVLQPSKN